MREILTVLIFAVTCSVMVLVVNFTESQDVESASKRKALLQNIDGVWLITGIPDIAKGSKVKISLYNDKITINDELAIPLDRIDQVKSFKVNEMRITDELMVPIAPSGLPWFTRIRVLIYCLFNVKVRHFLSIEFVDEKGADYKGLFVSGNGSVIKAFAETVNRQMGAGLGLEKALISGHSKPTL